MKATGLENRVWTAQMEEDKVTKSDWGTLCQPKYHPSVHPGRGSIRAPCELRPARPGRGGVCMPGDLRAVQLRRPLRWGLENTQEFVKYEKERKRSIKHFRRRNCVCPW